MTKIAVIFGAVALIIGGAFYLGTRYDATEDADAKTETLERVNDADVSKGSAKLDDAWNRQFIDGL